MIINTQIYDIHVFFQNLYTQYSRLDFNSKTLLLALVWESYILFFVKFFSIIKVFEMLFTKELMFETQNLKGIRQWIGKINGKRGIEPKEPPVLEI
jgi:hypothetical protein